MQAQLQNFNTASELRLIQSVSESIQSASDPLRQANSFITSFGIGPIADAGDARVVALCLAEFAYKNQEVTFDKAAPYVEKRYEKLAAKMPWGHKELVIKLQPLVEGQGVDVVSDKKAKALAIFQEFNGKINAHQITKKIAAELGLTMGNASYYVNRVFNKKK